MRAQEAIEVIDMFDSFITLLFINLKDNLSERVVHRLFSLYTKIDILFSWRQSAKRVHRDKSLEKIYESLWQSNFCLKYLFEEYINYFFMNGLPFLTCTLCNQTFPAESRTLLDHLSDKNHLIIYQHQKKKLSCDIWGSDISLWKLVNEKFICPVSGNQNLMFCKLCDTYFPIHTEKNNLMEHISGPKHYQMFTDLFKFCSNELKFNGCVSVTEASASITDSSEKIPLPLKNPPETLVEKSIVRSSNEVIVNDSNHFKHSKHSKATLEMSPNPLSLKRSKKSKSRESHSEGSKLQRPKIDSNSSKTQSRSEGSTLESRKIDSNCSKLQSHSFEKSEEEDMEETTFINEKMLKNFKTDRQNYFSKLISDADKEVEKSVNIFSSSYLKTDLVKSDLTNSLKDCGKIVNVCIIGSRAYGLAHEGSVIDIFVDIDDYYDVYRPGNRVMIKRCETIINYLKDDDYERFHNIKTDEINFNVSVLHRMTGLQCNIFCENGLVVENTKITSLYINSNNNIRNFIIIIRKWIEFSALNNLISNYAVCWMVIFFLMSRDKKPLLQPVTSLKKIFGDQLKPIAGWKTFRFDDEEDLAHASIELANSVINDYSSDDMLRDFFEFYSQNNLSRYVLCPLVGELISKTFDNIKYKNWIEINGMEWLENSEDKIVSAPLFLQDPLILNKNLTSVVSNEQFLKFQKQCKAMVKMYST